MEGPIQDVQETAAPTIEDLNKQIAVLQDQIIGLNNGIVQLKEAIVKQAIKL